jgi:hypothetical protein
VQQVFEDITGLVEAHLPPARRRIAILGDCTFHTTWATGYNAADLKLFAHRVKATQIDTIDLFGNPTIRLDLHEPIPADMRGMFDMVIDAGTLYCCFNVPAVWKNILDMLTPDGVAYHQAALTGYIGRGYYNLHPMLFRDFYTQNGFEIVAMRSLIRDHRVKGRPWRRLARRIIGAKNEMADIGKRTYLTAASWHALDFSDQQSGVPTILPADSDIICCAKRRSVVPFKNAVPPYYS